MLTNIYITIALNVVFNKANANNRKISHPSRHRSVIVFTDIKKVIGGSFTTAAYTPETNSI